MRELLTTLREEFDVIVIDAPPVLPVADARVLSEMADETIQVVRIGVTTKTALGTCPRSIVHLFQEACWHCAERGCRRDPAPTMITTDFATSTAGARRGNMKMLK